MWRNIGESGSPVAYASGVSDVPWKNTTTRRFQSGGTSMRYAAPASVPISVVDLISAQAHDANIASVKSTHIVIPAKAGIQRLCFSISTKEKKSLDSGFRRNDEPRIPDVIP